LITLHIVVISVSILSGNLYGFQGLILTGLGLLKWTERSKLQLQFDCGCGQDYCFAF